MEKRRFFRWQDLVWIGVVLAVLGGWLLWNRNGEQPAQGEIYLGSQLMLRVSLYNGEPRRFSLPEREHVWFYLDGAGGICFESSDCPDQICVHSGRLTRPGQTAACLPNQLLLRLTGPEEAVDTVG